MNPDKIRESKTALIAHIITSVAFIAMGCCILFLDTKWISIICYKFSIYTFGIVLIGFGLYFMLRFFFLHEYKRITNYGFTQGTIYVLLGSYVIFNAQTFSGYVDKAVYFIVFVFGAIMFQQAFALFQIKGTVWFISLILGIGTVVLSIYFCLNNIQIFNGDSIGGIFLLIIGVLSFISLLIMVLSLKYLKKLENSTVKEVERVDTVSDAFVEQNPLNDSYFDE